MTDSAPQPKDAEPDRFGCGSCGHTPNWHVDGYARCRHSRGEGRCDCPGFKPQPAAAVPSCGAPVVPCDDATHTHCNDPQCGCGCHEPEASGSQDTAADEPDWVTQLDKAIAASGMRLVFDPRNWTAPHTKRGPRATDPDREHPAHVGQTCDEYDAAQATAGGTASSGRHGWTFHGYPCCGKAEIGERPNMRARCMGNPRCSKCKADADAIHEASSEQGEVAP